PQVPEPEQGASKSIPSNASPSISPWTSLVKSKIFFLYDVRIFAFIKRSSKFRKILKRISETNRSTSGYLSKIINDLPPEAAQASHHLSSFWTGIKSSVFCEDKSCTS